MVLYLFTILNLAIHLNLNRDIRHDFFKIDTRILNHLPASLCSLHFLNVVINSQIYCFVSFSKLNFKQKQ
jgi:hypothetical protein